MDEIADGVEDDLGVPDEVRADFDTGGFRAGASLIADDDTQNLHDDLHGGERKMAAGSHEQVVDARDVKAGKFDEDVDREEMTSVTVVDERYEWNPSRDYYHGWSEDGNVVLLYRTETGARKREVVDYPFYFFVDRKEAEAAIPPEKWA